MITSSSAQNRSLSDWYSSIKNGHIKLPRFQRMEVWDSWRITSFLNTIIHNLPVGVALILKVGDKEQFQSRYIKTAKNVNETVHEHLLDGQQRLTSFWRVLHNNYEYQTFFVYFPEFDKYYESPWNDDITIFCRSRWHNKHGKKYPVWADIAERCLKRGCIPAHLFKPEDIQPEIDAWIQEATAYLEPSDDEPDALKKYKKYTEFQKKLTQMISNLRETIAHFNLPYLALPASTYKEVALQVFINMNTNSKPLSIYDIIVAEVESEIGESLHNLTNDIHTKFPNVESYFDLEFLVLATSSLLQDKLPNNRGMVDMDKSTMVKNWTLMEKCLGRMANFLESQGIFDRQRLPTNAVLAVLAASYSHIPDGGDIVGKYEILLKKYLWSSFFTDRYENAAAGRAYADYMALKAILTKKDRKDGQPYTENDVPVLNRELFSLADEAELISAGWSKKSSIRGRAILAVATYFGAIDFADGQKVSRHNIKSRHYHHVFPNALLKKVDQYADNALNCALISSKTNLEISNKEPLKYLEERYLWADKEIVADRLNSHLIPISELATGGYEDLVGEAKASKIKHDYDSFLRARAKLILKAMGFLVTGVDVHVHQVLNDKPQEATVEMYRHRIENGENKNTEFKSSFRYCIHRKTAQTEIAHSSLKTIVAFLNTDGGELFIGVRDDGELLGLKNDFKVSGKGKDKDAFLLTLDNLISAQIGATHMGNITIELPLIDGIQIAVIKVSGKANAPVWLKNQGKEQFFIRRSASSVELSGEETHKYTTDYWD